MSEERRVLTYDLGEGDPFGVSIASPPLVDEEKKEDTIDKDGVEDLTHEEEEGSEKEIVDDPTQPEEAEEEIEEEQEPEEEVEEEDDVNIHYYIARQLHKDGVIPEEFDIKDDIQYSEVISAYKNSMEKTVLPDLEQRAEQRVKEKGFDLELLPYARAYRNGVDPNLLNSSWSF